MIFHLIWHGNAESLSREADSDIVAEDATLLMYCAEDCLGAERGCDLEIHGKEKKKL